MNLNIEDVFKELKRNERKEKMKKFKKIKNVLKVVGMMRLNNCASHSRYFSDELDAQIFYPKKDV